MRHAPWTGAAVLAAAMMGTVTAARADLIEVGCVFDVHQDIMPLPWPNDFHVEGYICTSSAGAVPRLINHLDGIFHNFNATLTPVADCWWKFTADWWLNPPQAFQGIPFCVVVHLGLLFEVEDHNVMVDLHGWWTRDGQPIGPTHGGRNGGLTPILGFSVAAANPVNGQSLRIGVGNFPPGPQPPPGPWTQPIRVIDADVVAFPQGGVPPTLFESLYVGGPQESWPWKQVRHGNGSPVSPGNPLILEPDSFFDIFLEKDVPGQPGLMPGEQFSIPPGGVLVSRSLMRFVNNNGMEEEKWIWHIHEAQQPEACCLPDGTCRDLAPLDCVGIGGFPMGQGTTCATTICPQPTVGACCYGPGGWLCTVTTRQTCAQQWNGTWHGVGTDCSDINGNGIADICEPPATLEACCMPEGSCLMLPAAICLGHGGTPMGPGSRCLGNVGGGPGDDLCTAKWLQQPDLETTGIDILATGPLVLADDWECRERSLITQIRIWGSWKNDILPMQGDPSQVQFVLSIHRDIPAGPEPYSRPGELLWLRTFPPGSFQVMNYAADIDEGWWDPRNIGGYLFPGDHNCWLYTFTVPPMEAFCQDGSPGQPVIYWLDVQAMPVGGTTMAQFGWKTARTHWNDDAVWGEGQEPYPGPWRELRYPLLHPLYPLSIDLAFLLESTPPPSPPVVQAARSEKNHGVPGPVFPVDICAGEVEHRLGGPTAVTITFDRPVMLATGTPADVTVSSGMVTAVTQIASQVVVVNMTGAANAAPLFMRFPGVRSVPCGQAGAGGLCLRVLLGDVNGDGTVNIFDLVTVRNNLDRPLVPTNFRSDVTADGLINIYDMITVRNNFNRSVAACPVPPCW